MNKKKSVLISAFAVAALSTALASCGANKTSSATSVASSETTSSNSIVDSESSSIDDSEVTKKATGAISYVGEAYAEKTKILGKLEKYAINHNLTGLPLYENGGYAMYNDRVVKGTDSYITNYGFGILREGNIAAAMSAETVTDYQYYYHDYDVSDAGTINALNSDNSQVSDLYGNISSGYFGSKMNSAKDGYDWYGVLSTKKGPSAVKDDGTVVPYEDAGVATTYSTWRVYVRTGEKGGVAYSTLSTKADRAAYNGTYATLDDYVNAYKVLLNAKNGYYRGSELASKTGKSGFVGMADYYKATAEGDTSDEAKAAWKNVGIKSGTDTDGDYIDFTFLSPNTRFYAMYYLADGLYEPIPSSFFNLVGADNYGKWSSDLSYSPVDNILSVGPYTLESWTTDQVITYKRNANWYEIKADSSLYRIKGIHTAIISAMASDKTAAFKEFLAGKLDSCSIPDDYIATYASDTRAVKVPGSSTFKLNINSTTQEQWNSLFGTNGTIKKSSDDAYKVKPWMSNSNFLKGMMFSIDRNNFAKTRGVIPSINYFADAYQSDPENGISYNTTAEHKAAVNSFWGDTVSTYGYNLSISESFFKDAISELETAKAIPDDGKLTIDCWWMYTYMITNFGDEIGGYIQDAFNAASKALGKTYTLTFNNQAVTTWSDVYYKHLMIGQFDLGFGSISGNTLDPLNFMEVLKSNNSSGFTLNWGPDTSYVDTGSDKLVYDGKIWSYDTLWAAADSGVLVKDAVQLPPCVISFGKYTKNADGTATITFTYQDAKSIYADEPGIGDNDKLSFSVINFWLQSMNSSADDIEMTAKGTSFSDDLKGNLVSGSYDAATGLVTITVTADVATAMEADGFVFWGVYGTMTIDGVTGAFNTYTYFEVPTSTDSSSSAA